MSQMSLLSQDDPFIISSTTNYYPELTGYCGCALHMSSDCNQCDWIINVSATNYMTYDDNDLVCDYI